MGGLIGSLNQATELPNLFGDLTHVLANARDIADGSGAGSGPLDPLSTANGLTDGGFGLFSLVAHVPLLRRARRPPWASPAVS